MLAPWVTEEISTVDLKDKRLNARLGQLLTDLGAQPSASLSAACDGSSETEAAYRFFSNEKISFQQLLAPHYAMTRRRISEQQRVIVAQDTTEIDITRPQQQVEGAGPLDGGSRRGALLHALHAFTPDGTPLGSVEAVAWTRADHVPAPPRHAPIEDKESQRWVEGVRRAHELARATSQTEVICVGDSEADIYEVLAETQPQEAGAKFVVRAAYDRALLPNSPDNSEETPAKMRAAVAAQDVLFTKTIKVRGRKAKVSCEQRGRRQPRESRQATVEVRAARVTLRPPPRSDRQLPPVEVNVVWVREVNPPANDEPVDWLLLTDLPIDTAEQVREAVACYCIRWMIEVFFRTLKSGCHIEARRFEKLPRVLNCLALYMIVAWRTLYVCRLGRSCPDVSCEAIFEPAEWKSVYRIVKKKMPPKEPPSLREMVRMVAQLGGFNSRAKGAEPGPQVIWLGLARTNDFAHCWRTFGPETQKQPELV